MSGNPLKTVTDALNLPITIATKTLGMESPSDVLERELGTPDKMGSLEAQGKPPTLEDAKRNAVMGGPKTYGRMGTIKNIGGAKGVASSLLNLTSPSLQGK